MPSFSESSKNKLSTCDLRIQKILWEIIVDHDCTVIEGHRSRERQEELHKQGASKVRFGKHNQSPSKAIDVAPYIASRGIPWPVVGSQTYIKDLNQFYYFAGFVMDRAKTMGIELRYGGDWDRDHNLSDQSFDDLVHFELVN